MKTFQRVLFVALSIAFADGACPSVASIKPMANFNATAVKGTLWYLNKASSIWSAYNAACTNANISSTSQSITLQSGITVINVNYKTNSSNIFYGTVNVFGLSVKANLWVLDTDYVNYSLVYVCGTVSFIGSAPFEGSFLISRNKSLASSYVTKANNILKNAKLTTTPLTVAGVQC